MTTITIPASYVGAILQFPALKDKRRVLSGIYFESTESQAVMVGADGIILGAFRLPEPASDPVRVIVPREAFAKVKAKGGPVTVSVDAGGQHDSRTVVVSQGSILSVIPSIPGDYPCWRDFIPREPNGERAEFNFHHAARLVRAAEAIHGRSKGFRARITPNGKDKAALVSLGIDDFAGAIMPSIYRDSVTASPDWVHA